MSDRAVELFDRFLAEREAGANPDPAAFVQEAADQADAVAAMITAYLATHSQRDVAAEDVVAFAARPELAPVPAPAPWSKLLPALRARSRTTRGHLVARLAAVLGVTGAEQQVGDYVHELEAGLLSPRRVRPAVVSALAEILAVPKPLLEKSQQLELPPAASSATTFARLAVERDASQRMFSAEPPLDELVDDLFTGADDG